MAGIYAVALVDADLASPLTWFIDVLVRLPGSHGDVTFPRSGAFSGNALRVCA